MFAHLLLLKFKSLEITDDLFHERLHSISCFAADFHVNALPFPGLLAEVGVGPLVVRFVADYVDGANSVVVLYLSQPVLYALY